MNTPENTKTIYFIRHGQSDDNVAPVFQSPDSPLSAKGRRQAEAVAKRIASLKFDVLISSPLHRAKETAEIISQETGKKLELSDLFVERIKPDAIIGKPYVDTNASLLWREWEKSLYTPGMRIDNGENFDDLIKRADEVLDFLKNRIENHIVVVSHSYFLRTVVARVLLGDSLSGENFHNFQKVASIENTALTILKFKDAFEEDATWRLDTYNDYSHLDK
jgi:broad specificity phosphatase PhoE